MPVSIFITFILHNKHLLADDACPADLCFTTQSINSRVSLNRIYMKCRYCGSLHDLTVDHVTPVSKGGLWEWSNLVTACNTCNAKKGSRTLKQLGWTLRKLPAVSCLTRIVCCCIKSRVNYFQALNTNVLGLRSHQLHAA